MASSHPTDLVSEPLAERNDDPEYNDDLEILNQIGAIFDIPSIINESQDVPQIINYYQKSERFYRVLHSWEGFIHFGISYDGKHKRDDYKEPARVVERYIRDSDAKKALELAYGRGANMAFLARRNPHVVFDGVDLSQKPLKRYAKIPNAHFHLGDFHDLSNFEDDAYDIAFVVESLCYSNNKLQVLREVKKKLKRNGLFIIFDGYQTRRATPLSQIEEIGKRLIEKSMAVDNIEKVKDVENYMREEYSLVEAQDVTQCVLPSIIDHERKVSYFFTHPLFARIISKFFTYESIKNTIAVYLLPTVIKRQRACYYIHVLKNDK